LELDATAPVLVIGSTGDPTTSYAWSERMADALGGARLLTRDGEGHTAFWNTFFMGCTGAAVSAFLVDPEGGAPPATCQD
jgi:homoserine acetyltransferase